MAILSRSGGIRYFYNFFHCVLLSALTYVLSPTNLDHSSHITHHTSLEQVLHRLRTKEGARGVCTGGARHTARLT